MQTNPPLLLQQYVLHLGIMPTARTIEQLTLQALPSHTMQWQQARLQTAFISPYRADEDFNSRLISLLDGLLAKMPVQPVQQIVYLLLPEFTGPDNPQLNALLQGIMQRYPDLLQSEHCRVFPYGAAASLMALNAASRQLAQGGEGQAIWFFALDSLCQPAVFASYLADNAAYVLSEGALALCIGRSATGVLLQFCATDALTSASRDDGDIAVASLFQQLAGQLNDSQQSLEVICLPDSGNETASNNWLTQMQWLHGAVTSDTGYCFPGYVSGELGACGGLYRLLYLLNLAQKGRLAGLTLQFEQSANGYRSVALLTPDTATI